MLKFFEYVIKMFPGIIEYSTCINCKIIKKNLWIYNFTVYTSGVASYDSQGHGGGIRPRLHTGGSPQWTNSVI
jgi:hypothetical protein